MTNFSNRPESEVNRKLLYDFKDVSVAPCGEYWRQMKSICVLQLLSNKRVHSFRHIQNDETELLMKKINEASPYAVNLSELFLTLTNDVASREAFGRKYGEGESGRRFRSLMKEFVGLLGGFDFGTFLPWLGWIDRISGLTAKVDKVAKEMDEFLESVLEEHLDGDRKSMTQGNGGGNGEDFTDVLLDILRNNEDGISKDEDSVKSLLLVRICLPLPL